ncbi:MAG: Small GTP-binding domain protein, ARF-domain signature (modular protein) [Promethearchaeota archaeon]|nr:MAG: Small GTP-binding domain protein, ARF-domain signature (modular protein) [Candidatus Lokiarchaeota archaeon]
MENSNNKIIKSIILSVFDESGPEPVVIWPESMDQMSTMLIAMKTISLLMGDSTYQDSFEIDGINYFGVIPFPDLKLNGLTYFFLIPDPEARGQAKAATITVLVNENNRTFFYENMKYLRVIIDRTATEIQRTPKPVSYEEIIMSLRNELTEFTNELKDPFSSKRTIKVVFAGLDKAGKTSFLLGVKKKYSEIIKSLPTKGVDRSREHLLSEESSQIMIWDLGGQKKYLDRYFEQSKVYLYNIDLLFFFVDIQDSGRLDSSLALFSRIITSLKELDEFPPIVICLNKYDPDLKDSVEIDKNVDYMKKEIKSLSDRFFVKIFKTSIFAHWSLISAYSFGLSQLSPNRKLFKQQLKRFAKKTKTDAILLLNESGIILSNYSKDDVSGKVFEISAPHFQTLYKTFKEFKLLKEDFIITSGITDDSKKLVFKKIKVDKYHLYLLILLENQIEIEKIEKNLPDLSTNLIELINTYI